MAIHKNLLVIHIIISPDMPKTFSVPHSHLRPRRRRPTVRGARSGLSRYRSRISPPLAGTTMLVTLLV